MSGYNVGLGSILSNMLGHNVGYGSLLLNMLGNASNVLIHKMSHVGV